MVSDGTNRLFTRAGDFYVDGNGYLCMSSTGYTLQGWQVDAKGNVIKDTVSSLQVMSSATKPQLRRLQQRHMYQVCLIKMMPRQPTPEESSL